MKPPPPSDPGSLEIGGLTNVVRHAAVPDLPRIVEIHQRSFANFFLTRLGSEFLHRYYNLVLDYRSGIVLVSERQNALQGFACGFVDPADFYQRMWRARLTFAIPVLSALIRHPSLMMKVLYGVRRIQSTASRWPERSCELSSIAVVPEKTGSGCGKALIESFLNKARSMDAHCVFLTTDAEGNDAANAFYRNVGFQQTRRFRQGGGRWMNEYAINGWKGGDGCEPLP
ncbi:MAG TPA: GNAT family N-acetyltransferase [Bryobacteraceae bacterium]|nr:GNAT family N-acetyltransferase [Bryobacteraceae bacterium]